MPHLVRRCWRIWLLLAYLFIGSSCHTSTSSGYDNNPSAGQEQKSHRKHKKHRNTDQYRQQKQSDQRESGSQVRSGSVPRKAYDVLAYVKKNGRAMDGYVGGRRFGNYEGHLPRQDLSGRRINYQEWDVNPKMQGRNRGTERLVTGSDGRSWYTNDHYNTFIEVK